MKLNLGSGYYPMDGYHNVDMHHPADTQADFRTLTFTDVEEVVMSHVLEHLPWRETVPTLQLVHSWMRSGGKLVVEVPDMRAIFAMGFSRVTMGYTYGEQSTEGEFHKTGFSAASLAQKLDEGGFRRHVHRAFLSEHVARPGLPCLEFIAFAK